jgi:serine/threonine-protein kinase RsbW
MVLPVVPPSDASDPSDPIPTVAEAVNWKHVSLTRSFEVVPLLEAITREMAAAGYSEKDRFGMRLALDEALVNAIRHGHQYDPRKRVRVRYAVSPQQILAEIEDEGAGFDRQQVPDPTAVENLERTSGRGLLLIEHYTTWVRYNARGNCVTICKCPSSNP